LEWYNKESKANRAKIQAEISPEYEAMRTARNTKDLAMEIIRSLKYFLRNSEDEYREAGKYQ
jgi:Tfp pilus assembly PilM family ATPase